VNSARIQSLEVKSAPGMPGGLPILEKFSPGLTVIVGPNASGKSTIARVLRSMLWEEELHSDDEVTALWAVGEDKFRARVLSGRVTWKPERPAGIPSGAGGLVRLGIRDLLDTEGAADRDVATRLARELAGGLDLVALGRSFSRAERLSSKTKLARDCRDATTAVGLAERSAKSLGEDEKNLDKLDRKIEKSEQARKELVKVHALRDVLLARAKLGEVEARVVNFPEGIENLKGDEAEELETLKRESQELRSERGNYETEIGRANESLAGASFEEKPPGIEELVKYEGHIERIERDSSELRKLERDLSGVDDRRESALRRLTFNGELGPAPTPERLDALKATIDSLRSARASTAAAESAVELWEGWASEHDKDDDALRVTIRDLRVWLRLPEHGAVVDSRSVRPGQSLTVFGAIAIVMGIVALWSNTPGDAIGIGSIVFGFAMWLVWLVGLYVRKIASGKDSSPTDLRLSVRRSVEAVGLVPDSWTTDSVTVYLEGLERDLAKAEVAKRALGQADSANQERDSQKEKVKLWKDKVGEELRNAGLAEDLGELDAVGQLAALGRWQEAEDECIGLEKKIATAQEFVEGDLGSFADWLQTYGEERPSDVDAARGARAALSVRAARFVKATQDYARATPQCERIDRALEKNQRLVSEVWKRAGLDGEASASPAELQRRLEAIPAFDEWRKAVAEARSEKRVLDKRLENAGRPSGLEGRDCESVRLEEVETWIKGLEELDGQLTGHVDKRGQVSQKLRDATQGHELEDAIAVRRAADTSVAEERESAVEDALARMLLGDARTAHADAHAPELLLRARTRFHAFAEGRWRLEVDPGGTFFAVDSDHQPVDLEELSDGTRMQLLLAARLTALEHLETDVTVPIALDEALSTTDPRRFLAVAEAVFHIVREGRQVLYLTADPSEVAQWSNAARVLGHDAPQVVDLGVLCKEPADWAGELPASPDSPEEIPDPAGKTPAAYARVLGVTPPDGFSPPHTWHLYFATYDDLDALAALLKMRIRTIGHLLATRRAAAPLPINEARALTISARADLGLTLARLWRIGRGRPVKWRDVEESKAVSKNWTEPVEGVHGLHSNNAQLFVNEVAALKGFHSDKAKALQEHLREVGCLPTESPLSVEYLVQQAIQGEPDATNQLGGAAAAAYLEWLAHLLSA
jgi:DNA repair protein SbcC/Rad50